MQLFPWKDVMYGRKLSAAEKEGNNMWETIEILTFFNSRGTMSTFLFLSLLSALCPAAQSPMEKRGVWFVIS